MKELDNKPAAAQDAAVESWWQRPLPPFTFASGIAMLMGGGLCLAAIAGILIYQLLPFPGWKTVEACSGPVYMVALIASLYTGARVSFVLFGAMMVSAGIGMTCIIYTHGLGHQSGVYVTLLYMLAIVAATIAIGALLPPLTGWTRNLRGQWRAVAMAVAASVIISTIVSHKLDAPVGETVTGMLVVVGTYFAIGIGNDIRHTRHNMQHVLLSCMGLTAVCGVTAFLVISRYF